MKSGRRRTSRSFLTSAVVLGGVGAAIAAPLALKAVRDRWAATEDPTEGRPLELPDGRPLRIETPDGAVLSGLDCGPAGVPPVVMLHGWTADSRVWAATARRLVAMGHRVVVYDHRGHGRSTRGEIPLTVGQLADDLDVVLRAIDAHGAVLVGHSMGGMTVLSFALDHPETLAERVAALVLVSTAADRVVPRLYQRWGSTVVAAPALTRNFSRPGTGALLARGSVGRHAALPHLLATAETFSATPGEVRGAFLRSMTDLDLTTRLASIGIPTTVISGTRDTLTVPARSRTIVSSIPGAELVVVPGGGHQLVFEAPQILADAIAARIPTPGPVDAGAGTTR